MDRGAWPATLHGVAKELDVTEQQNSNNTVVQLLSCEVVPDSFVTPWAAIRQAPLSMEFSRQEYWSGLPFPSPGIFPTQGLNPGLLHCRQIHYRLSHPGGLFSELNWLFSYYPVFIGTLKVPVNLSPHLILSGRSPGEGNGNPLQYSCLENSMDRGAGQVAVHRIAESDTTV